MNRRELFTVTSYLLAGAVMIRIAKLLPTAGASVPYVVGGRPEMFRPASQGTLIHVRANPYLPKEYVARLEALTILARQSASGYEGVTQSLTKFQRKLDEAKTVQHST